MTNLARCCVCSFIIFIHWYNPASSQVVDIPDPNLESAIRETLALPDEVPLTQLVMKQLIRMSASQRNIQDLTGLEYSTNLQDLSIWGNPFSDLSPLSNLTNLTCLEAAGCPIVDISPLTNLVNLKILNLRFNQIVDISPLANLVQLEELYIGNNPIYDFSPLDNLFLNVLERDEFCAVPSPPIIQRIANRTFPSVFASWGGDRLEPCS